MTITPRIRPAEPSDAAAIAAIEQEVARTPGLLNARPGEIPVSAFRDTIDALRDGKCGIYLVAECERQVIGHLLLQPLPLAARAHVCTLTIVMHPQWQGRGLGRSLLAHGIDWARGNPCIEKIELTVRADNTRAIALYESLGFEREGLLKQRVRGDDGKCRDDIAMALFVKP